MDSEKTEPDLPCFEAVYYRPYFYSSCCLFGAQRLHPGSGPRAPGVQSPEKSQSDGSPAKQARVSLSPRFSPGQSMRYETVFETSTTTTRSGIATDPQGPSKLVITWNATIRLDVLPADASIPGGIRLRITYEKSAADIRSDTFDPNAAVTQNQYHDLEGKILEFTLDGGGNVTGCFRARRRCRG